MTNIRDAINEVLRSTVIHSPSTYSWFGVRSLDLRPRVRRSVGAELTRGYLLQNLTTQLYTDFYCRGGPRPAQQGGGGGLGGPNRKHFVSRLSVANAGEGSWSEGWTVREDNGPTLVVERDGLSLWVDRAALSPIEAAPVGSVTGTASTVRLPLPKSSERGSPGFYLTRGAAELAPSGTDQILRLYWNLIPDGAETLIRRATTELSRAALPYQLKVLDSPETYARCDAGVLYVRKDDYPAVAQIVAGLYRDVAGWLGSRTPMFTKVLAPGLALAEDPGAGASFGDHRCRLLADGIIRAFERRVPAGNRLSVVAERFAEEGIDLDAPFLNPGSSDQYDILEIGPRSRPSAAVGLPSAQRTCGPGRLLDAAHRIGRRLVDEAVWDGDRCNWVGMDAKDLRVQAPTMYRALGPNLYSGTSGLATFLSQLYAASGDDAVRRTANGAVRQALAVLDAESAQPELGLFTGHTGVALTAIRAAALLGEPDLAERGGALLDRVLREADHEAEFDVIAGKAGALLALLAVRDVLDAPAIDAHAVLLGDRLLDTAVAEEEGLSWSSATMPAIHNLTGFSHGAAGVGAALAGLFHATGDERYRRGAENAFRYERHWFSADEANWPDLRDDETIKNPSKGGPFPFMTVWCHGAPGIALSRIRAFQLLGDELLYKEAAVGLRTTREWVLRELQAGPENYTLCHGLAGNADVLLQGWQAFGADFADGRDAAHEVARFGIEQYGDSGRPWPCLGTAEEMLSLMTGLAGIGYFLLRLRDPRIPSILLIQPVQRW